MAMQQPVAALVTPDGTVEVLDSVEAQLVDVLQQRPHHFVPLANGWQLAWSSAAYQYNDVNHLASLMAGQSVKGDACFLSSTPPHERRQGLALLLEGCKHAKGTPTMPSQRAQSPHQAKARQLVAPQLAAPNPAMQQQQSGRHGSLQRTIGAHHALARILRHIPSLTLIRPLQDRGTSSTSSNSSTSSSITHENMETFSNPAAASEAAAHMSLHTAVRPSASHALFPGSNMQPASNIDDQVLEQTASGVQQQQEAQAHGVDVPSVSSPCGSRSSSSCGVAAAMGPAWCDLPEGIVSRIGGLVCNGSVVELQRFCDMCSAWRRAVLEDDRLLKQLHFCWTDPEAPFKHGPRLAPHVLRARLRHASSAYPKLLERAAKLKNISALVCIARLLDASGSGADALKYWKKAAQGGHVEGQLLLGLALYRGTHGAFEKDDEGAHMWLSRAVKAVAPMVEGPGAGKQRGAAVAAGGAAAVAGGAAAVAAGGAAAVAVAGAAAASGGAAAAGGGAGAAAVAGAGAGVTGGALVAAAAGGPTVIPSAAATAVQDPPHPTATTAPTAASAISAATTATPVASATAPGLEPVSQELRHQVLAQAGLVLGYMHFDGDGERVSDKEEAVRLFKLAAAHGSQEAASVLGWVFNTGQFG